MNSNICLKQSTDLRDLLIVHPSSKFNRQLYIVHFLCAGTAVAPFIIRAWFSCRSSLLPIHSLGRQVTNTCSLSRFSLSSSYLIWRHMQNWSLLRGDTLRCTAVFILSLLCTSAMSQDCSLSVQFLLKKIILKFVLMAYNNTSVQNSFLVIACCLVYMA